MSKLEISEAMRRFISAWDDLAQTEHMAVWREGCTPYMATKFSELEAARAAILDQCPSE